MLCNYASRTLQRTQHFPTCHRRDFHQRKMVIRLTAANPTTDTNKILMRTREQHLLPHGKWPSQSYRLKIQRQNRRPSFPTLTRRRNMTGRCTVIASSTNLYAIISSTKCGSRQLTAHVRNSLTQVSTSSNACKYRTNS